MSIKSIIIDNQTKATRIDTDKVQLELTAFLVDEENNTEPNSELRLYINSQLLQTIKSDEEGKIKESLVINDSENEQLLVKIEDIVQGIQSKLKYIMIEGESKNHEEKETESKINDIYELYKDIISPFKKINEYFQKTIGTKNEFNETTEQKIGILSKIKSKLEETKTIDLLSPYKQDLQIMIESYYEKITICEIDDDFKKTTLQEIEDKKNNLVIKSNEDEIKNNKEAIESSKESLNFYEKNYDYKQVSFYKRYISDLEKDNKNLLNEIEEIKKSQK